MKIYGKAQVIAQLSAFGNTGRFPHALMFHGENGCGKMILADYTAMLILCPESNGKPCESCNVCRKVASHIHPDIVYVRDACGGKYNVDAMRKIISESSLLPNDGDTRVYIFENADDMSVICQNTLLKLIEEPQRFNRFIFTVGSLSPVLPTIISRVTSLAVANTDVTECEQALADFGIPAARTAELSALYEGNIGRCLAAENGESEDRSPEIALAIATALSRKNEYEVAAAFSRLTDRETRQKTLFLLSEILGNAMACSSGNVSPAFMEEVTRKLSRAVSLKNLDRCARSVEKMTELSDFNPNLQLAAAQSAVMLTEMLYQN